jgi:hypothetical protein
MVSDREKSQSTFVSKTAKIVSFEAIDHNYAVESDTHCHIHVNDNVNLRKKDAITNYGVIGCW